MGVGDGVGAQPLIIMGHSRWVCSHCVLSERWMLACCEPFAEVLHGKMRVGSGDYPCLLREAYHTGNATNFQRKRLQVSLVMHACICSSLCPGGARPVPACISACLPSWASHTLRLCAACAQGRPEGRADHGDGAERP